MGDLHCRFRNALGVGWLIDRIKPRTASSVVVPKGDDVTPSIGSTAVGTRPTPPVIRAEGAE